MKGIGYRCDHCHSTVTTDEAAPIAEGWVVLSYLADNPFGSPDVGEYHACCWLCAAALARDRFDPDDGPIPDGVDGGVFMGAPT